MGKYSKIINTLPKSYGTEPDHQQRIDKVKVELLAPVDPDKPGSLSLEDVGKLVEQSNELFQAINLSFLRATEGRRHASVFAKVWRELRRLKDTIDEWESDVNLLLEAYGQLIVEQYEVEGTTSLKLDTGDSVSVQEEPYSSVKDRDALLEWALAAGLKRSLSLPWMTLNAITKERLLAGLPEPDGVVATARPKLVLRKG